MKAIRDKLVRPAILAVALLAVSQGAAAQQVLIGTGDADIMQYSVGRAICHLAGRAGAASCKPMETGSAIDSLVNVAGGALDFALVPADLHYHAIEGSGPFAFIDTNVADLRSVFSLYGEALTLVVNTESGIATLDDLRGRRVNLGAAGTREAAFSEIILAAMGWTSQDFAFVDRLTRREQTLALCHRRLDALIHYGAHPSPALSQAALLCEGQIIGLNGGGADKLRAAAPYLVPLTLPGDLYEDTSGPIATLGVRMTLVANAVVAEETVEALVAAVFEELSRFRKMHPAFANLEPGAMIREGQFAPLHAGAESYYRAKGLM
jgi:TRAP transporter TAXI family solute receptor